MVTLGNMTIVILVVAGAIVLCGGIAGGYIASLNAPEQFPAYMFVAFVGIILALAGIAMGMGKSESGK
ncbi:MAG: hypothetical protein NTU57_03400 [Candidatus Aenigmarchaeota archaeon]|nr:hypothetical protein [Candidatus Aenigmarchaeota archaeon]